VYPTLARHTTSVGRAAKESSRSTTPTADAHGASPLRMDERSIAQVGGVMPRRAGRASPPPIRSPCGAGNSARELPQWGRMCPSPRFSGGREGANFLLLAPTVECIGGAAPYHSSRSRSARCPLREKRRLTPSGDVKSEAARAAPAQQAAPNCVTLHQRFCAVGSRRRLLPHRARCGQSSRSQSMPPER
jgi:hypothetical protein